MTIPEEQTAKQRAYASACRTANIVRLVGKSGTQLLERSTELEPGVFRFTVRERVEASQSLELCGRWGTGEIRLATVALCDRNFSEGDTINVNTNVW